MEVLTSAEFQTDPETGVRYRLLDFIKCPGYRVGTDGSVWSKLKYGEWRRLKPMFNWKYHTVRLTKRKWYLVHRLVLLAFVGPCPDGMECRHKNGNPTDNWVDNLTWGPKRTRTNVSIVVQPDIVRTIRREYDETAISMTEIPNVGD